MKHLKNILTIAALLLTTGVWAQDGAAGKFVYNYQLDGAQSSADAAGTVVGSISGTTATLTVTPGDGKYITKDDITVYKLIKGQYAEGRTRDPNLPSPVEITAANANADPSETTTYTFTVTDEIFDYEVTANFHAQVSIANATVTTAQTSYPYTGQPIEPVVTVKLATGATLTLDKDYTVTYANNTNVPATANDPQPTVTVTGKGMYNGTKAVNFTISKIDINLVTVPQAKAGLYYNGEMMDLIEQGSTTDGTIKYSLNGGAYSTDIPQGKLPGDYSITYLVEGDANHNSLPASDPITATISKAAPTLNSTPTAKTNLTFNGSAQELVTAGSVTGGTMQYSVDGGDFSETVPTKTDAGTYSVVWKVTETDLYSGIPASDPISVTIAKAAGTISFAKATVDKTYGDAAFTNELTNTGDGTVTYVSLNANVATVDETGLVTITGNGEATIKATVADGTNYTYENKTASYLVSVGTDVMEVTADGFTGTYDGQAHGITVNAPDGATVKYGETEGDYKYDASPTYTDAATYTVFYQVTKENYTTVTGSQTVTINKAAGSISYTTTTVNKTEGDAGFTNTLTNNGDGTVTYSSSDDKVAYVDANGYVTIVGPGSATITATVTDGVNYSYSTKTVSYTLTVEPQEEPVEPTLDWVDAEQNPVDDVTVTLGEENPALPTLNNPENLAVTYASTDTSVATVDENGAVTILAAGSTTISAAFAGNDDYTEKTVSYTLIVEEAQEPEPQPVEPTLSWVDANQNPVDAVTVTLKGDYSALPTLSNPENLAVTYASTETSVASVDEMTGAVNIITTGTTTISAIFKGNDDYTEKTASYDLTVEEAQEPEPQPQPVEPTLSWVDANNNVVNAVTVTLGGDYSALPTLSKTEGLEVTYDSTDPNVASISETGAVNIRAEGTTTISAIFKGNDDYTQKTARYILTVNRAPGEGYLLWVNDTQVTSDNAKDVLGHDKNPELPFYIFNAEKKQLLIDHDQTRTTVIESRMPELNIYLMDVSKIDHIFFNNTGDESKKGTLTFTTNGNFPGKLLLANSTEGESAIKGFSDISYKWDLTALEPDGSYYDTETLEMKYKDETEAIIIADTITIGEAIVPITENRTITFEESQLVEKDEDGNVKRDESGNPIKANLSNYSYAPSSTTGEPEKNVIHISLNPANIGEDAGGFDIENGVGGIYIEDTMTDEKAGQVAQDVNDNKMVPGGTLYAESYDGFTFKVIAGSGTIEIDEIVGDDYEFHLIIGTNKPITLDESNSTVTRYNESQRQRVQAEIAFNVGVPTYCFLYMVKKTAGARSIVPIGKRDTHHGKLVSISVSVSKVKETDPPSEASGGVLPVEEDPEIVIAPDGIDTISYDRVGNDRWYNLNGQQIEQPTKKGLYIINRKKVVIK